jgi:hypothetical protein
MLSNRLHIWCRVRNEWKFLEEKYLYAAGKEKKYSLCLWNFGTYIVVLLNWRHSVYVEYTNILDKVPLYKGARGGAVDETQRFKPVGRGIDSRWCH